MDAATITILCTSIATLVGLVLNYLREGRAHKWAKDEADAARAERIQTALELKAHTDASALSVAANTKQGVAVLVDRIDTARAELAENTAINVESIKKSDINFDIANHSQDKLIMLAEAGLVQLKKNVEPT